MTQTPPLPLAGIVRADLPTEHAYAAYLAAGKQWLPAPPPTRKPSRMQRPPTPPHHHCKA